MTSAPETGRTAACAHCGRPLTAEEQEYYGTSCERCETELHHAMQDDRAPVLPPPPNEVERLRAEIAQLRSRLLEAEQGGEAMREAYARLLETFPEQILAWHSRGPRSPPGNGYRATTRADLAAAIRGLPLNPNQEAGDHEPR